MDPISLALAGGGLLKSFYDQNRAEGTQKQAIATQQQNVGTQQQNLAFQMAQALRNLQFQQGNYTDTLRGINQNQLDSLMQAMLGARSARGAATATRTDQFGNKSYYDPTTNSWQTQLSPEQQRALEADQAQRGRVAARGAQASQDYDKLRSDYLYRRPKDEATAQAEIMQLIQQAQGTGDRALNTLVNRQELRQKGNLPVIYSGTETNPNPGQRLAQTMLEARKQALAETLQREQGHQSQYLPALRQFEQTANTRAPESTVGSGVTGAQGDQAKMLLQAILSGNSDLLGTYTNFGKNLLAAQNAGAGNVGGAYTSGAAGVGGGYGQIGNALSGVANAQSGLANIEKGQPPAQYASLIAALKPNAAMVKAGQSAGTLGGTTGATFSQTDVPSFGSTPSYNTSGFTPQTGIPLPPSKPFIADDTFNDRWVF